MAEIHLVKLLIWIGHNEVIARDLLGFWLRWCDVAWFALIWFGLGWLGSILQGIISLCGCIGAARVESFFWGFFMFLG